jgi:X-X-X-Leu-X-X-Gly heptad repeat protein
MVAVPTSLPSSEEFDHKAGSVADASCVASDILPDDGVVTFADGVVIVADGIVTLSDGVVTLSGGVVTRSDGCGAGKTFGDAGVSVGYVSSTDSADSPGTTRKGSCASEDRPDDAARLNA